MAKAACWIELRYGWGLKGTPIAQTGNPKLLQEAKRVILAEAERKATISKQVDTVLGSIEELELVKLQRILDMIIPDTPEAESA